MNYCNNKNREDEENIILNDIKSIPPIISTNPELFWENKK